MALSLKDISQSHNQHYDVNYNAGKYVEAMKTGYGEEEICKVGRGSRTVSIRKRISSPTMHLHGVSESIPMPGNLKMQAPPVSSRPSK